MSNYVHNKSTANVSLINGKIMLKVGEKVHISAKDAEHEEVIHALRLGWITIEGEVSGTANPEAVPGIVFKEDEMKGSLTIPGKEPAPVVEEVVPPVEEVVPAPKATTKAKAAAK